MIDPDFLLFLIKEKEQQKLTATQEQVKRLDVEIKQAKRLYKDETHTRETMPSNRKASP